MVSILILDKSIIFDINKFFIYKGKIMLYKKLQDLKNCSGMTIQEISDKSKVPLPTVKRIFSGQTPDPGYSSVIAIVKALNGSIDDIQEVLQENSRSAATTQKMYSVYEKNIHEKNQLIKCLLIISISMTAIFIFLLVWDFLNPSIGLFRKMQDENNYAICYETNLPNYTRVLNEYKSF